MNKLVLYPNDILTQKCQPISQFDSELHALLDSMKQVMDQYNGLGISANQIGELTTAFLAKDNLGNTQEFINPKIALTEGLVMLNEGCLSAPNVFIPVARPGWVMVDYFDRTGASKSLQATGIFARCILHEMDHLNGEFYFDKVNRAVRKAALSKLRKNK